MPILDLGVVRKSSSARIAQGRTIDVLIRNARTEEGEDHEVANAQCLSSEVVTFSLFQLTFDDVKPVADFVCNFLCLFFSYLVCRHEECA